MHRLAREIVLQIVQVTGDAHEDVNDVVDGSILRRLSRRRVPASLIFLRLRLLRHGQLFKLVLGAVRELLEQLLQFGVKGQEYLLLIRAEAIAD